MTRFDFQHPPFDVLTAGERETVEAAADIVFHGNDEVLLAPAQPVECLYMVIKGIVREMAGEEVLALYREHDTFDARALVAGQTQHRFEVDEEALLYSLPKEVVLHLIESNPVFGAFFFQSISENFRSAVKGHCR